MLNHSGVCLSLFLVESALFSEPQCSHAPRCYALLLVQLHVYVESSLPLCRTEAVLTSSLPSVLVQHFVFPCFWDFCPFPFPSFHASNTAPYFRISRFQFPWLIVPFNITFSAESIELCLSRLQDCHHPVLSRGSHLPSLLILPPSLSFSICLSKRSGCSLLSVSQSHHFYFLPGIRFKTYLLKQVPFFFFFFKSSHLCREIQQTNKIILVVFTSSYFP